MPSNRGLFITLEGGEGAGKSTLMHRLLHKLHAGGHSALGTREPGGTALGEEIRRYLLHRPSHHPIAAQAELLLFLAARAQHLEEKIIPALSAGTVVLCDRFNDSTIAYQGYARGLGVDAVEALCTHVSKEAPPDLTFFLDIPPQVGLSRKSSGPAGFDRIELEARNFHEKVREGLQLLAEKYPKRIVRLDATLPIDEVCKAAWRHIQERLQRCSNIS